MKLIILMPAYNEELTIEKTILSIPRKITGVDKVEVLVVDDGSTDKTVEMAMNGGADKVVSHTTNLGVGAAFMTGIRNAIKMGADVVITIDADFQMDSNQIPTLLIPILNNQYDVIIGSRFENKIPDDYPFIKKIGNKFFTKLVSWATGQKFSDTQSGFRAYSREAFLAITVVNDFTYTQEVLIDLKFKGFRIGSVPVTMRYHRTNSKVVKNVFSYSARVISIILKSLVFYRPILAFGLFGIVLCGSGILAKILTVYANFGISSGLSTSVIILGIVSFMMGLFASVVFKRQIFTEKDLRHHINELIKSKD